MSDSRHQPPKDSAPQKRGGLRLVKQNDVAPAEEAASPRRKSHLLQFMTAYADAIDRDIQAILDL